MADSEDKISDIKRFIDNIGSYEAINRYINDDNIDEIYPNDETTQIKHFLNKINSDTINN